MEPETTQDDEEAALFPFVREGRIASYPRKWARRLALLRWLVRGFEPGRLYREAEVNVALGGHALDHATLRRYLVDASLLQRDSYVYWRAAGVGEAPSEID